jgi:hypothetical protein
MLYIDSPFATYKILLTEGSRISQELVELNKKHLDNLHELVSCIFSDNDNLETMKLVANGDEESHGISVSFLQKDFSVFEFESEDEESEIKDILMDIIMDKLMLIEPEDITDLDLNVYFERGKKSLIIAES